ncbi:hypothetical protein Pcinc_017654 [Petrolisthes cinctipes]|uniref:Ionotropic glutamate receptor C-terminal domain-containing protein n=1 Tax=Petrolisthes cinctipes TaxID=88211 RepID=A0AAE1FPN4_PETCI|nr:hypothetical protein Pcinc_017654 [Petrolisthes cinctipes]
MVVTSTVSVMMVMVMVMVMVVMMSNTTLSLILTPSITQDGGVGWSILQKAMKEVLGASSRPHCSLIFLTDGSTPRLQLNQASTSHNKYLTQQVPHTTSTSHNKYLTQQVPHTTSTSHNKYLTQQVPHTTSTSHNKYLTQQVPHTTSTSHNKYLTQQVPHTTQATHNTSTSQHKHLTQHKQLTTQVPHNTNNSHNKHLTQHKQLTTQVPHNTSTSQVPHTTSTSHNKYLTQHKQLTTRLIRVVDWWGGGGVGGGVGVVEVQAGKLTPTNLTQAISLVLPHARQPRMLSRCQLLLSRCQLRLLSWCVTVVVVSDQFSFLTSFATAADDLRLLVWSTRLLVVSRLPLLQLHHLLSSYWAFSMMNTAFLAQRTLQHTQAGGGAAQVVRVASWSEGRGLVMGTPGQTLYQHKYNTFHGGEVNMTVFPFPPYWMDETADTDGGRRNDEEEEEGDGDGGRRKEEEEEENGDKRWRKEEEEGRMKEDEEERRMKEEEDGVMVGITGRDYIILETIAASLNFTINVLPYGEWDEVMARLEDRTAYMSPIKLAIMPHLLEIYDFTLFIEPATLGFTMAKPTLKPRWQSLYYPLRPSVWASIMATLLVVPVVFIWVGRQVDEVVQEVKSDEWTWWRATEVMLGSLLGHTFPGTLSQRSSVRLVTASWLVFAFIAGTAYRSNLTAFLTVPKYPPRPETLAQLIGVGASVVLPPDMVDFYRSFEESNSDVFRKLYERIEFVQDFKEGMQQAIQSNKAYMYERLNSELMMAEHFTDAEGRTPLYVNNENVMPGYCGWPLTRDAPIKHVLDAYIMACHGGGLIEKWTTDVLRTARTENRKKQLHKRNQRRNKKEKAMVEKEEEEGVEEEEEGATETQESGTKNQALTLVHMQGPLFLFLLGVLLSLAAFILEVLFLKVCCLPLHRLRQQEK